MDWSSQIPIKNDPSLAEITSNPKTKIVRVSDEVFYVAMSFPLNIGLQHATYSHILKCDIDYQLTNPDLLKSLNIEQGQKQFFCGTAPYKWDFHGFAFFKKEDALRINGYNERFRGWGWDDEDFYRRMEKSGLERIVITNLEDFIRHIPHDDSLRTANYPDQQKNKDVTNVQNALISLEGDCGCLSTYHVVVEEPRYVELLRVRTTT